MKPLLYYPILDEDYEKKEKRAKLDRVEGIIKKKLASTMRLADNPESADILLIGGGDGFMFKSIRKYHSLKKPFFGINAGTVGFLYNQPEEIIDLPHTLDDITCYKAPIIPLSIEYKNGETKNGFYVNDLQLGRFTKGSATFSLEGNKDNNGNKRSKEIRGTMLLVNTPLGSTGYGAGLRQNLLPWSDNIRGVVGMASGAFKEQSIDPQTLKISIESRYQIDANLDGEADEHNDIQSVTISQPKEYATLAFLKETDFITRRHFAAEERLKSQSTFLF